MIFIDKTMRKVHYLIATIGLSFILISGPFPIIMLANVFQERSAIIIKDILQTFGFPTNEIPLWALPLSFITLTISLALVGFLVWLPSWRFLQRGMQKPGNNHSPDIDKRLHSCWTVFLAGVAIIGDLLMLGLYFLIIFLSFGWGNNRTPREIHLYLLSVLLLAGLLLGHMGMALLISRYHLWLLRK